ncbi:MAG: chemotaxis protein CheA [Candidatus Eisenbacteria sp.]|nr:chemotaxis protein CheA [Candidatus Eisenbacteria bacterium]
MAANNSQIFSMQDALIILATAKLEDVGQLTCARDGLTSLLAMDLLSEDASARIKAARDALDRVLSGDTADPASVLSGAGEAIEQAVQISETGAVMKSKTCQTEPSAQGPAGSVDSGPDNAGETEPGGSGETEPGDSADTSPPVLSEDADGELLAEYIAESLDHIAASEAALLELELNPDDSEALNTVFRAFHTIKGTSGFLGLFKCQEMAHKAENILHRAREGELRLTGGYADLSLESCDVLKSMIQALDGLNPGDPLTIPADYEPLFAKLTDPEAAGISSESGKVEPADRVGDILVAQGKVSREEVEEAVTQQGEEPLGQTLREMGVVKSADVSKALRAQKQMGKGSAAEATIRVGTGRLDSLINMVGELVIAQSMVSQDPEVLEGSRPQLTKNVAHASKIVRDLQDLSMGLRMVPLKGTFQKMARLVRDLSRKSGKSVRFETEGEDTEIDRNMVEVLNDPLVHMIRNSVDHGIEIPGERLKVGKPETGTVRLRAYHSAGNVVIELIDDGKGLDKEKILAKALDSGLIRPDHNLSENDVFALILNAGLSTADKITDVSGRGVGLDVVKTSIESLRGRLQVSSKAGIGSTFTLHLPLTLAISDAMLVRVGEERYLIPTVSIEQSFRPEAETLSTVEGRGEIVMLRGEIVPIVRLSDLFGVRNSVKELTEGLLIAVEAEGSRCALVVDELLGQYQIVVKTLGQGMGEIPGVSGGTILADGCVGLILDVAGLLKMSRAGAKIGAAKSSGPEGGEDATAQKPAPQQVAEPAAKAA